MFFSVDYGLKKKYQKILDNFVVLLYNMGIANSKRNRTTMTNYTIHFYGVQFSNCPTVKKVDENEIVEPISEQEYRDLVEGNGDTFYDAFCAICKRVEKRFGKKVEYVSNWEAAVEEK